ncbi:phage holin family protein [Algibacter agarivorans]|uniref:Phage holin family protein n=1 Tax=Algibacter agarivorans TaxID=1109741 RepID=A0ABP9GCW6_9FLAO
MNLILRLLLNALAVFALANILTGVSVDGYMSAIIVALVLSILNLLVKPLLVILTLPVTIITLGLFLLVINGLIILLADEFINGFSVDSIWWAILFSILLSILQSFLQSFLKKDKKVL